MEKQILVFCFSILLHFLLVYHHDNNHAECWDRCIKWNVLTIKFQLFFKKIFFCIFYCNTLFAFSKCLLSWIVAMEPDGFWIISTMSMMQLAVFNTPSSQAVTNWIIDRVVQDYWVLNSEIILSKKKIGAVSSELSLHYSHTRWSLGLNMTACGCHGRLSAINTESF